MKKLIQKILAVCFILTLVSCVEPYALQTNTFEDYLVVEATITNELKQQEVKLSRTYKLEQGAPSLVQGATVQVKDNQGNDYSFTEIGGRYLSNATFKAQPGVSYQLKITTSSGRKYSSNMETLTTENPLQSLTPEVVTRSDGKVGVEMTVKAFDPTNSSKYYRYEFEETYKIIAPLWKGVQPDYFPPQAPPSGYIVELIPIPYEARICYSTKKADKIILHNTNNLSEDRVNFSVLFVDKSDFKITNRYSIIIKQYVQNLASYTYYKTLNEISTSGSILTQNQPGFVYGNLSCESNPDEKVIGYFEVSSTSSKRIFFNYNEVFPNSELPVNPFKCVRKTDDGKNPNQNYITFKFGQPPCDDCGGPRLVAGFNAREISYFDNIGLRYEIYPIQCGDCTSFSSNIRPTFWID